MRLFLASFIALVVFSQAPLAASVKVNSKADPTWEDFAFVIEDSRCFIGIAPVYLTVTKLTPQDGNLIGYYEIKVPLKTSKNDRGKIVLPLDFTVKNMNAKGGVLKGKAHSEVKEGIINDIVCKIIPQKDQTIKLAITTKDRTLKFVSRYSIIVNEKPKGES